jgi:hypothetical protein
MHDHGEHRPKQEDTRSFWRTPLGWAFIGFAAVAVFFLVTEHTAHVFGFLPWLLVLACPLMHIFMHRGHGHGRHRHDRGEPQEPGPRDNTPTPRR